MKTTATYFQNDPDRPLVYGEAEIDNRPRRRLRGEPEKPGILCESDIPKEISGILGHSHSERINTLVEELITQTGISNTLRMRPKVAEAMDALRTFMFEKVYRNPVAKGEESKARDILKSLYEHYMRHPEQLPENFRPQLDFDGIERVVCDYIACMTDKYAIYQYEQIFIPSGWQMR